MSLGLKLSFMITRWILSLVEGKSRFTKPNDKNKPKELSNSTPTTALHKVTYTSIPESLMTYKCSSNPMHKKEMEMST